MTGVEHYQAAEELLSQAAQHKVGTRRRAALVREAQAHAMLAQAAAARVGAGPNPSEREAWGLAAGDGESWDSVRENRRLRRYADRKAANRAARGGER